MIDPETAGISLAARPDILIAGTTQYFGAVVRMTAVGELDPLFGSAGLQRLGDNAVRNVAYGIAQRANGSMIVGVQRLVGATTNTDVFALDASGMPDPSFNNGAPLTIDFGVSAQVVQLALQDDGKIVVAATLEGATHNEIGLARVTAAGTLDATFGVGGIVSSRPEGTASYQVEDVVFAADRIVVVGTQTELNGSPVLFIARYLP